MTRPFKVVPPNKEGEKEAENERQRALEDHFHQVREEAEQPNGRPTLAPLNKDTVAAAGQLVTMAGESQRKVYLPKVGPGGVPIGRSIVVKNEGNGGSYCQQIIAHNGDTIDDFQYSGIIPGDSITLVAARNGKWVSLGRNGDFIYPEDFGAVGDGTTDDWKAFQACLDYAGLHDKTIKLRIGQWYVCNKNLLVWGNASIVGEHRNNCGIILDGNISSLLGVGYEKYWINFGLKTMPVLGSTVGTTETWTGSFKSFTIKATSNVNDQPNTACHLLQWHNADGWLHEDIFVDALDTQLSEPAGDQNYTTTATSLVDGSWVSSSKCDNGLMYRCNHSINKATSTGGGGCINMANMNNVDFVENYVWGSGDDVLVVISGLNSECHNVRLYKNNCYSTHGRLGILGGYDCEMVGNYHERQEGSDAAWGNSQMLMCGPPLSSLTTGTVPTRCRVIGNHAYIPAGPASSPGHRLMDLSGGRDIVAKGNVLKCDIVGGTHRVDISVYIMYNNWTDADGLDTGTDPWVISTAYNTNDLVVHNDGGGNDGYTCRQPHTATAANEPGVGVSWVAYWTRFFYAKPRNIVFDGNICSGSNPPSVQEVTAVPPMQVGPITYINNVAAYYNIVGPASLFDSSNRTTGDTATGKAQSYSFQNVPGINAKDPHPVVQWKVYDIRAGQTVQGVSNHGRDKFYPHTTGWLLYFTVELDAALNSDDVDFKIYKTGGAQVLDTLTVRAVPTVVPVDGPDTGIMDGNGRADRLFLTTDYFTLEATAGGSLMGSYDAIVTLYAARTS